MTGNGNGHDSHTMIERVAEAIWMANRPREAPEYKDLDFHIQDRVELIAIECIRAMREPTGRMLEAVVVDPAEVSTTLKFWTDMIDAALEEE